MTGNSGILAVHRDQVCSPSAWTWVWTLEMEMLKYLNGCLPECDWEQMQKWGNELMFDVFKKECIPRRKTTPSCLGLVSQKRKAQYCGKISPLFILPKPGFELGCGFGLNPEENQEGSDTAEWVPANGNVGQPSKQSKQSKQYGTGADKQAPRPPQPRACQANLEMTPRGRCVCASCSSPSSQLWNQDSRWAAADGLLPAPGSTHSVSGHTHTHACSALQTYQNALSLKVIDGILLSSQG